MSTYPPPMPPRRSVAGTTVKVLLTLLAVFAGVCALGLVFVVVLVQLT